MPLPGPLALALAPWPCLLLRIRQVDDLSARFASAKGSADSEMAALAARARQDADELAATKAALAAAQAQLAQTQAQLAKVHRAPVALSLYITLTSRSLLTRSLPRWCVSH